MNITVKVKPNAGENTIKLLESGIFEVKVTVPPEKGKANAKVIELLAKQLKIPKSRIFLIKGKTSSLKIFQIDN